MSRRGQVLTFVAQSWAAVPDQMYHTQKEPALSTELWWIIHGLRSHPLLGKPSPLWILSAEDFFPFIPSLLHLSSSYSGACTAALRWTLKGRLAALEFQPCHLVAVWCWISNFISLEFSHLRSGSDALACSPLSLCLSVSLSLRVVGGKLGPCVGAQREQ